jgi:hypothetical protein
MDDQLVRRNIPAIGIGLIADESLISFIYRLARRRRVLSPQKLAAECGFDRLTNQPRPEWLARLADLAGCAYSQLEALTYGPPDDLMNANFRGRTLNPRVLRRRGGADRRVCPQCLEESEYHRAIWDPVFVSICPVHLKELVDACDNCGRELRWVGRSLSWCRCKRKIPRDLRRIRAPDVPSEDAEATKAAFGLLGDDRFATEASRARALVPFADLEDGEIVEFVFRLGLEVLGPRNQIFSVEKLYEAAWQAHIAFKLGFGAVESWPDGFHAVLDTMCRRSANYPAGRWKWLRPVERWVARLPTGRGLAIREAVEEYKAA